MMHSVFLMLGLFRICGSSTSTLVDYGDNGAISPFARSASFAVGVRKSQLVREAKTKH